MSTTPLIDRIKRGNHPTVRHGVAGEPRTGCLVPHETAGGRIIPIGNRRPVWLRRLDEKVPLLKDVKGYIHDGCGPDGRAA